MDELHRSTLMRALRNISMIPTLETYHIWQCLESLGLVTIDHPGGVAGIAEPDGYIISTASLTPAGASLLALLPCRQDWLRLPGGRIYHRTFVPVANRVAPLCNRRDSRHPYDVHFSQFPPTDKVCSRCLEEQAYKEKEEPT